MQRTIVKIKKMRKQHGHISTSLVGAKEVDEGLLGIADNSRESKCFVYALSQVPGSND